MEIKDGVVDITWLGPESWLGVRLGVWILIVSLLSLLLLLVAKQDWHERINNSALLKRFLPYIVAALFLPPMGYVVYLLGLAVLNGVSDNGLVWIPQGVLVFAAVGLFSAKGWLLLWKPLEECTCHPRDLRQRYVDVFQDGVAFGIAGLVLGLATGHRATADETAFAFGILGIILSIIGEAIRYSRHTLSKGSSSV